MQRELIFDLTSWSDQNDPFEAFSLKKDPLPSGKAKNWTPHPYFFAQYPRAIRQEFLFHAVTVDINYAKQERCLNLM